jgi:Kae1-associated kinase Bud32
VTEKILYLGAEAEIRLSEYMGKKVVQKQRVHKAYRIKEIDHQLISYRTKEEAKLISAARSHGVSVPLLYDVDLTKGCITMEYLKGNRVKDMLNGLKESERRRICLKIGESIARLHDHDLIHGDLTTSNMIYWNARIYWALRTSRWRLRESIFMCSWRLLNPPIRNILVVLRLFLKVIPSIFKGMLQEL